MKIDSDGNGGTHVKFKANPGRVKLAVSSGIVVTLLLTMGGWVYGIGAKAERLDQICKNDLKQDVRIAEIEKQIVKIDVIKNDIGWIRTTLEEMKGKK